MSAVRVLTVFAHLDELLLQAALYPWVCVVALGALPNHVLLLFLLFLLLVLLLLVVGWQLECVPVTAASVVAICKARRGGCLRVWVLCLCGWHTAPQQQAVLLQGLAAGMRHQPQEAISVLLYRDLYHTCNKPANSCQFLWFFFFFFF